ncbi:hypothetical protein N7452_009612 [Penicillium brevicompactum]|uniref:Uncharacterized protein n=1 Tax=Penicillium brevicompactum TaxID=5074 RepID=A0A9W9UA97_PENBR|nr:hypothetical protein N7452_009612 [Penicillium brevicompactum]
MDPAAYGKLLEGAHLRASHFHVYEAIPKLRGEVNWSTWKRDFCEALEAQGSANLGILRGEITAPTEPIAQAVTQREAEILCYQDVMSTEEFEAFRGAEYDKSATSGDQIPRAPTINAKLASIEEANAKEREVYGKNLTSFTIAATRIWNYMKACVEDNALEAISSIRDPHEAFERLRVLYGPPSPQINIHRWKALAEIHYTGKNAAGYIRRFQQLRVEWEECIGHRVDFETEYSAFIASILDNPRCTTFVQNFQSTTAQAMYHDFLTSETNQQPFQSFRPTGKGEFIDSPEHTIPTVSRNKGKEGQSAKESPNFQPADKPGTRWCPYHQRWVRHAKEDCRGKPAPNNPTIAANATQLIPENRHIIAAPYSHGTDSMQIMNQLGDQLPSALYFPDADLPRLPLRTPVGVSTSNGAQYTNYAAPHVASVPENTQLRPTLPPRSLRDIIEACRDEATIANLFGRRDHH